MDERGPSLKEYLETRLNLLTVSVHERLAEMDLRYQQRFDAQESAMKTAFNAAKEAVNAALSASDRAVSKAELAAEKRFEGVNEFRETLGDQQRTLMPRSEVDVLMKGMNEKIGKLEAAVLAKQSESAGVKGGWGYAVGVLGLVMLILSIAMAFMKMGVKP
jgi:hypothetical protein